MATVTPGLLAKLKAIISKHHTAFVVKVFGTKVAPAADVQALKHAGLIPENAEEAPEDSYLYGQVTAKVEDPAVAKWPASKVAAWVKENPVVLSEAEQAAADIAALTGAEYVQSLSGTVEKEVVQAVIAANIVNQQTVKKLKSALGHATGDWTKNLDKIAITEKHNAMQMGVADGIRKKYGPDARVFIRRMPDACATCKKFADGPDGAPRIYKLSQLAGPGANVKQKQADWVPCIGTNHPHCQCSIQRVPAGWGFNDAGVLAPDGKLGVEVIDDDDDLEKGRKLVRRMEFQGFPISVETDTGQKREWYDPHSGEAGTTTMAYPYGYIRMSEGADGDHVDCYVGPNKDAANVYVVHQHKKPDFKEYDEDKCMLGFESAEKAKAAYLMHFSDPRFFGSMTTMPVETFRKKVHATKDNPGKLKKGGPGSGIRSPTWQRLQADLDGPAKQKFLKVIANAYSNAISGKAEPVEKAMLEFNMQKAGGHLYTSKEWHHGHWVYEYAAKVGGKVHEHATDPDKLMVKVPIEHKAGLIAEKAKHGVKEHVFDSGDKTKAMLVISKPVAAPTPPPMVIPIAVAKPPVGAPAVSATTAATQTVVSPAHASTLEALAKHSGMSHEAIKAALGTPAGRVTLTQHVLSGNLAKARAVTEVMQGHSVGRVASYVTSITKGSPEDIVRATKEFMRTPQMDVEAMKKLEMKGAADTPKCYFMEGRVVMGHGSDDVTGAKAGDYTTGDFRHELGHAIHGTFINNPVLDGHVQAAYVSALTRRSTHPDGGEPKDLGWYEKNWGLISNRCGDDHKEFVAEHYRGYHRTVLQHSTNKGTPKGSRNLFEYAENHPEMAKFWDAHYTVALLHQKHQKGEL